MTDKKLYKIVFLNHGKVYELYSEGVTTSGLWGFVEISDLVFETVDREVRAELASIGYEGWASAEVSQPAVG